MEETLKPVAIVEDQGQRFSVIGIKGGKEEQVGWVSDITSNAFKNLLMLVNVMGYDELRIIDRQIHKAIAVNLKTPSA
jgi:hypothetical protein